MKKLKQEKQLRKHKRLRFLTGLVLVIVFLLTTVQLFVSNHLSNLGEKIEEEERKTEVLIAENRILEEELREKESLTTITEKAKKLGFVEAKSIYYLVPQIPVAMK